MEREGLPPCVIVGSKYPHSGSFIYYHTADDEATPLRIYQYIYVHHKTLSGKAVGFRYWISRFATAPDIVKQDEGYPKEMTKCPLCNIDLEVDDIRLESHLSDLHGNLFEVAKALTNILERLEQIERNIEKSHGPIN